MRNADLGIGPLARLTVPVGVAGRAGTQTGDALVRIAGRGRVDVETVKASHAHVVGRTKLAVVNTAGQALSVHGLKVPFALSAHVI